MLVDPVAHIPSGGYSQDRSVVRGGAASWPGGAATRLLMARSIRGTSVSFRLAASTFPCKGEAHVVR